MRRFALAALALIVAAPAFAAESTVNTGATSDADVMPWEPGTAVTILPDTAATGMARRMKNRKAIAIQNQHDTATCCIDPDAPATTATSCARGWRIGPGETWSRNWGGAIPIRAACTAATFDKTAGKSLMVDQGR